MMLIAAIVPHKSWCEVIPKRAVTETHIPPSHTREVVVAVDATVFHFIPLLYLSNRAGPSFLAVLNRLSFLNLPASTVSSIHC